MYKNLSDYGIIGNLETVALVGLDGGVDWLCLPRLQAPSVFGALLDDAKGGAFCICPEDAYDASACYEDGTNILVTRFRTRGGLATLTDFMPMAQGDAAVTGSSGRQRLVRRVRVTQGSMRLSVRLDPRPDYGRAEADLAVRGARDGKAGGPLVVARLPGHQEADGPPLNLWLRGEAAFTLGADGAAVAVLELAAGDCRWFCLEWGPDVPEVRRLKRPQAPEPPEPPDPSDMENALETTRKAWRSWLSRCETGRVAEPGPFREMIDRSALVLKLLYYQPSGAIAAAATTSLPEEVGGVRNWDYRYTWVRDTAFTLKALFSLGHMSETEGYLRWVERLLADCDGPGELQVMYGLDGARDLPESTLDHLDGYKGSLPVRIGNAAAGQRQLDIYGEIMDAALQLSTYAGKVDAGLWPMLAGICDYVVEHWREPDAGIWEVRGGPWHFVYSKVMCWVALDRGVTIARRYGFSGDLARWKKAMEAIKAEVLDKGYDREKGAFIQHYETTALDAAVLLIPAMGFLPIEDERVRSTVRAVRKELGHGDNQAFLYRYAGEDGLPGGEAAFLLCSFWLIDCLTDMGELDEAQVLLARMEGAANHLGLFTEEYDPVWREALGNLPQAFSHIGYVNSAMRIQAAKAARERAKRPVPERRRESLVRSLLAPALMLNEGAPRKDHDSQDLVSNLMRTMHRLRGAFFASGERVAYEDMAASDLYADYVDLARGLKSFDPWGLTGHKKRLAFWINVYNALVIHGVVALGVRDSVKELRNFFGRVRYDIGGHHFTPADVEHGVLRGNRRSPHGLFAPFGAGDPRRDLAVTDAEGRADARIHFALVCASSSCPPIEVYTATDLDRELRLAGQAFLAGGGLIIERERGRVALSRVFQWYANDFGAEPDILRFCAGFLHDAEDARYLRNNAEDLGVRYLPYDWRLNRTDEGRSTIWR